MNIYISTNIACAVKIKGNKIDLSNNNPIKIEGLNGGCFESPSPPLIEICPINSNLTPSFYLIDKSFLSSPPDNVIVTDLKGGYLINVFISTVKSELTVIREHKSSFLTAKVILQNGFYLTIENNQDYYLENLFLPIVSAEFHYFNQGFLTLLIRCENNNNYLVVFNVKNKIKKTNCFQFNSFSLLRQGFSTEKHCLDHLKHKINIEYQVGFNGLKEVKRQISCKKQLSLNRLPDFLVPYLFLEEVLVGGDFSVYLGGNALKNADKICAYMGDFIGVLPPPSFISTECVGLIFNKTPNTYEVCYATFELLDKKIINLSLDKE